jgi:arginyl-tRNA synthetase
VKPDALARVLIPTILEQQDKYGSDVNSASPSGETTSTERKKVVIEFSSPNIASELQGKHLRSTIIGAFLARLYDSMGWDVTRMNFLGDWGKPIALLYVGWKKFGSETTFEADPVGHLLDVYHKIEKLFQPEQAASKQARDEAVKEGRDEGEAQQEIENTGIFAERNQASKKLEAGDEEVLAFWKRVREAVIADYESFYDRLAVRFDDYSGESEVHTETMVEAEQMLKDQGISEESAGAWMVDMTKLGAKAGHAIIRDRTGSSMYLLRDLAAVLERSRKYSFDKMIYVVASDNSVHFSQMFTILAALDKDLASKLYHIKFSEASRMAAALGNGYKPGVILDKCEEAMALLPEVDADKAAVTGDSDLALKALGTSALLVQELSTRSSSAHAFDTKTLPSFKLGSGPDLQYWYTKLVTLLADHTATAALSDEDFEALTDDDQANLSRILAQYPEVVNATFHSLEPSGIVTYLASVTEQLSDCLDEEEGEISVTPGLAALLEATRVVLRNGMKLLGLVPIPDLPQERADTPVAG